MLRRRFIQGVATGVAGLWLPSVYGLTFDEYKAQQSTSFQDYKARFKAAELVFSSEIRQHWMTAELSSSYQFVQYSNDLWLRSKVDFEAGTITLEAQGSSPAESGKKIKQALQDLLGLDTQQAYSNDPVQQLVDRSDAKGNAKVVPKQPVVGDLYQGVSVAEILATAKISIEEDRKPVAKVVIKLPEGSTSKKASQYKVMVEKYAAKEKISAALVMAVMHTESYFNPMARSHIPAFGLMQIVPESAGLDTTQYLSGKARIMRAAELYQPETNIQSGAAYLHLLYYRYLSHIDDPVSRLYCTIAAYNTGAGNVARSFTGRTNVGQAAVMINRLQPQQVYTHLRKNLPYTETRDYLEKVTNRMALYTA
ncbi:murein transglycosylase domain-containing protein [Oceanospirillum maris]|uniref:transglycosylase SLT domain-containing protein n=1 Tax=Oceanospirillum maris TaxID=64977 RepID=UPI000429969D|nr:murein transglycosylase domain-containing protein [Oceanospirillum maris]